jgi:hypothetical protein
MRRSTIFFLATSSITLALVAASGTGCQGTSSGGGGTGTGGSTNSIPTDTSNTTTNDTTSNETSGNTSGSTSTVNTGTGGAGPQVVTIQDITTGVVGPKVAVQLKGVVAMTHKFLVSQSKSTGSCLWGIFASAPGLTETAPNSGILMVSYGTPATTNDAGKAYCPVPDPNGTGPAGDAFPDNVAPGDVLDVEGKTDYYAPSSCGTLSTDSTVKQYQVSNIAPGNVKSVSQGGPVPTPHELTGTDIASLSALTDKTFHDKWGGVKVRIKNVAPVLVTPDGGTASGVVGDFGNITLQPGNVILSDKIYYQGLLGAKDACHKGPIYASTTTTFTEIDAFSYLNFCTWELLPANKCTDLQPGSDDCTGLTCN